jgi:phage terminase Nu1 subunit (DNA packaging protein)
MRIEGIAALCDFFGCSHQAVANWRAEGMPVLEAGGANRPSIFDSVAVHEWLLQRAVTKVKPEDQRERLARLQGDKVAMEIAEQQKLLIPTAAVEPKWRAACVAAREQLLRERRRAVAALNKAKTPKERDQVLAAVHDRFLRTLADWRGAGDEDRAS